MSHKRKWTDEDITDQTGRLAIVTGANSGIGYETARALAEKKAAVILAVRNLEAGQAAVDRIKSSVPSANLETMHLDLSSLASVRSFAEDFPKKHQKLDLLINNAGVMMPPYSKTEDGFELQFGTNHLGHFALTGLLLTLVMSTPDSRIVNVASQAHRAGEITFDDLNREKEYKPMSAYGQSKLANLLFTYELQRKLDRKSASTIAVAAHPGWTATNLQRHVGLIDFLNRFFAQGSRAGSWPTLYAATAPDVKGSDYFGPNWLYEMRGHPKKVESNDKSHDEAVAARLWDVSEELTGVTFDL
jgi:NAD(P)-dependent dehydrogenase (short-subunit alcohol dehydrogenase family)